MSTRSDFSRSLAPTLARPAAVGFAVVLLVGCGPDDPTEIVAGVITQMQVPRELSTVGVAVQSGGRLVHCLYYPVDDGTVTLPSTLGMQPEGDPSVPVTVTVLGFDQPPPDSSYDCLMGLPDVGDDEVSVLRRRRMPYAEEQILYLPMALKHSCADVECPTSDETGALSETCIGGQCQSALLDPASLPVYSDALVYGDQSTCFDMELCLPSWGVLPAFLVDRDSCIFEIVPPEGEELDQARGLNVVVLHDDFSPEVLDLDPLEGFTIPDPAEPLRFQLAPSLCAARYSQGLIAGVWASPVCPSKTPFQPLCSASQQALLDGTSGFSGTELCVEGMPLEATASALYVVMDRSAAMAPYFGEQGLEQVLSLSLDDPAFQNTMIAFKLAPASASECGLEPNSYAALDPITDVPFAMAEEARLGVAAQVSDIGNLLGDNPPLFWDVVMSPGGAYGALEDLSPPAPSTSFNRRGLLLLGNRDFFSRCAGSAELWQLASNAALTAANLRTYAVVLGADPTVPQEGHDPYTDAQSIASSGLGLAFDARTDPTAGATAMLTLAAELGSCLYDPPSTVIESDRVISYLDPVTSFRVDIPHDAACTGEGTFASGWGMDQGRVRICGWPCDELRNTLRMVSAAAAQAGLGAPAVPLRVASQGSCQP